MSAKSGRRIVGKERLKPKVRGGYSEETSKAPCEGAEEDKESLTEERPLWTKQPKCVLCCQCCQSARADSEGLTTRLNLYRSTTMADCQIRCIDLSSTNRAHEHITHVGNPGAWSGKLTVAQAVDHIRRGVNTFYVMDAAGNRANVGVVDVNPPHLRTHADGQWTNNLLSLTSCPI